jgi:hypothetical protein
MFNIESKEKFKEAVVAELYKRSQQAIEALAERMASREQDFDGSTDVPEPDEIEIYFDLSDVPVVQSIAGLLGLDIEVDDDGEITILDDRDDLISKFFDEVDAKNIPYDVVMDDEAEDATEMEESLDEEKPSRYTVYQLDVRGKRKNKEELNADELDAWMYKVYGKYATVEVNAVYQSGKKRKIVYTDNGKEFVKVKTESLDEIAKLRKHTKATDKLAHQRYYRKNKAKLKLKMKRYRKTSHYKRLVAKGKIKRRSGKTATGRRIVKRV